MKMLLTLEHEDVLRQIEKILGFQGLQSVGDILFRKRRKQEGYEIVVECCVADAPLTVCPTCGVALQQGMSVQSSTPVHKITQQEPPDIEPQTLELEKSQMLANADTVDEPEEPESEPEPESESETDVPSITSLKAMSNKLIREREREMRRGSPQLMPGESFTPPKIGR